MIKFGIILSFALSFSTSFAGEVRDPTNVLTELDQFVGAPSFVEHFNCSAGANYFDYVDRCEYGCDPNWGCGTVCFGKEGEFAHAVTGCGEDSLLFYSEDGYSLEVTPESFLKNNSNFIRMFLPDIGSLVGINDGVLEITRGQSATYEIARGTPDARKVEAMNLIGNLHSESLGGDFDVLVTVGKDLPAVAQILRLRIETTTFFRLKDMTIE